MVKYKTLDFLGYPGYRIGDDGSIWSRWKRVGLSGRKGTKAVLADKWHKLKPSPDEDGYLGTSLANGEPGKRLMKSFKIHKLVLLAFVGPRPPGMVACHNPDRSPSNNRLSNLRWDTQKGNLADAVRDGTTTRGERNYFAELTEAEVIGIRLRFSERGSRHPTEILSVLASETGMSPDAIKLIAKRKTWAYLEDGFPPVSFDREKAETREERIARGVCCVSGCNTPLTVSTALCERHHREKLDRQKTWRSRRPNQLIIEPPKE